MLHHSPPDWLTIYLTPVILCLLMSVLSDLLKIEREYNIYKLTQEEAVTKAKAVLAEYKKNQDSLIKPSSIKLSRFSFGKR